eukprot:SRR837773.8088.p2 GENE.SRR837773.8088~~SRR837773.8088.p2  ORF type:complete len:160 (+),score=28.93 SRR837773.8088:78-557(+)
MYSPVIDFKRLSWSFFSWITSCLLEVACAATSIASLYCRRDTGDHVRRLAGDQRSDVARVQAQHQQGPEVALRGVGPDLDPAPHQKRQADVDDEHAGARLPFLHDLLGREVQRPLGLRGQQPPEALGEAREERKATIRGRTNGSRRFSTVAEKWACAAG